jgi:hypothetical protein
MRIPARVGRTETRSRAFSFTEISNIARDLDRDSNAIPGSVEWFPSVIETLNAIFTKHASRQSFLTPHLAEVRAADPGSRPWPTRPP